MNEQTIQMTVVNHPTAFLRILGVFSRRGIRIDSISITKANEADLSNVSMTVECDAGMMDNLIKQIAKQMDVIHIFKTSDNEFPS